MSVLSRRAFLSGAAAGLAAAAAARGAGRRRPNVLFFLADDLGWRDTEPYGSQYYNTPNISRLAARSLRFTDAYSANPLCSPTRASILTGKYPARLQITTPAGHLEPHPPGTPMMPDTAPPHVPLLLPDSRRFLPPEELTLAEVFRANGYRTAHFGKWHLGVRPEHWPEQQGYEHVFHGAPDPGPPSYFSPYRFQAGTVTNGPDGEYITDRVTDEVIRYLEAHRDEPFFLSFWEWSVHAPYQAKEDYIESVRGRGDPLGYQGNPIMHGMIRSLDESIGRTLDALDRLGLGDDTIVIFTSDNGGNMYDRPGDLPPTDNRPLRSGKGSPFEGGVRVPLLIRWPGVTRDGATCSVPVMSIDHFATLTEACGLPDPPEHEPDGVSLVPLLRGGDRLAREALFCHYPHHVAPATGLLSEPCTWVRRGDWKLFRVYQTSELFPARHLLFNLRDDIGETHNVAAEHPELVRELDALIEAHLKQIRALVPSPNPAYDPTALAELDGWRAGGTCSLAWADGAMVVRSNGGDPIIACQQPPAASGNLVLRYRVRSTASGAGQFFRTDARWAQFGPACRVDFNPPHTAEWTEVAVPFDVQGALTSLRLDPASGPGELTIDWIRLEQADGTVLRAWEFAARP